VRVRTAPIRGAAKRGEETLLVECPLGEPEPTKYWLATVEKNISFRALVDLAKMRWRVERDYLDASGTADDGGNGVVAGCTGPHDFIMIGRTLAQTASYWTLEQPCRAWQPYREDHVGAAPSMPQLPDALG
jgi:SRSO17 transposase